MNLDRVFVYGSLMAGHPNHGYLYGYPCAGAGVMPNFALIDLGHYPGLLPCACGSADFARGEIYSAGDDIDALLQQLDRFEHNGSMYRRLALPVYPDDGSKPVLCWAYVYLPGLEAIPGGSWDGGSNHRGLGGGLS